MKRSAFSYVLGHLESMAVEAARDVLERHGLGTLFAVRPIDCERARLDVTGSAESVQTTDGLNITLGGPFLQSDRLTVSGPGSMRRAPQKVSGQLMD